MTAFALTSADMIADLRDELALIGRAMQDARNTLLHAESDEVKLAAADKLDALERQHRETWAHIAEAATTAGGAQ